MNIFDYADALNLEVEITRYSNQGGRWSAHFTTIEGGVEVKEGSILTSAYGNGTSMFGAIRDYVDQIGGKRIVVCAMSPDRRREYTVPMNLEVGPTGG